MSKPPFLLGRDAYRFGARLSDNPFPKPEKPVTGDDYPGDWQNWRDGWVHSYFVAQHEKRRRENGTA